ncbi:hypothetical protein WG922_09050 [Ramlibacter sp. AN1015]|uniref:hypothetical protein n=1 Tax=Ramlibacter sp. AN1015 TaxID=3133428 RepID=UPI0030BD5DE1
MRWLKPNIKSSLYALLGHSGGPADETLQAGTERIRAAMLALLGDRAELEVPLLVRRLRHATEVQTLWYARSDLMAALAAQRGEARARQEVERLTPLFAGLVPGGLCARPSRTYDRQDTIPPQV